MTAGGTQAARISTVEDTMAITLTDAGARIYLTGDTYSIRDRIKRLGGHWDGERRAWWVGRAKRAEAEQLASQAPAAPTPASDRPAARDQTPDRSARVQARARYKGKDYYVLAETRDGGKLLLAARNGAFQFWAAREAAPIVKIYGRVDLRTGRMEYPTIGGLIRLAEEWRQMSQDEREEAEDAAARRDGDWCPCSGGACRCGSDAPCCMCD